MSARSSSPNAGRSGRPPSGGSAPVTAESARPPGPLRTCIGCRSRERPTELLRVVVVDGVVLPDLRRRLPGRGAWLHSSTECLDAAERRRAFGRALRVPGQLDITKIRELLEVQESAGSDRPEA